MLLDKVAEQLSGYCLPMPHTAALQPPCRRPSAPVVQIHFGYFNDYNHLPTAPGGLEGKEHVDNTKRLRIKEIRGLEKLLKPKGVSTTVS